MNNLKIIIICAIRKIKLNIQATENKTEYTESGSRKIYLDHRIQKGTTHISHRYCHCTFYVNYEAIKNQLVY